MVRLPATCGAFACHAWCVCLPRVVMLRVDAWFICHAAHVFLLLCIFLVSHIGKTFHQALIQDILLGVLRTNSYDESADSLTLHLYNITVYTLYNITVLNNKLLL